MKTVHGDIWRLRVDETIVIPTNIGWRRDGSNVMGAGLAKQASMKYDGLARWYGEICRACGGFTPVCRADDLPLILFPVKPLNQREPHLSWKSGASQSLIYKSILQLREIVREDEKVLIPTVGCGNGGLDPDQVVPDMERLLDDRFTHVVYG